MATIDKQKLIEKIKKLEPLSKEEELYYMTEILKLPMEEALKVIEIAENKNPNVMLD